MSEFLSKMSIVPGTLVALGYHFIEAAHESQPIDCIHLSNLVVKMCFALMAVLGKRGHKV